MSTQSRVAFAIYAAHVVFMIGVGLMLAFRSEFMPFHSEVIETSWDQLNWRSQTLYLGMMRTEGAGFLASGVAVVATTCPQSG